MGLTKDGYWSERELLGYGAKWSFVLSDRGRGKTWRIKRFLLEQPGPSMCLYRQSSDMEHAVQSWTDGMDGAFKWSGNLKNGLQLLVDDEVKVYFRYLTAVNHIKQEVFPESLSWVFFDEFIPVAYKKLPGVDSEGDAMRTIVKTIEHDSVRSRKEKGLKPVRVILAGNPVTWNNPVLSYFHVNGLLGYGCHRAGPGVAWEWLPPVDVDDVERSLGADVHQSAAGINSAASFVKKAPRDSPLWMTVRLGEMTFRVSRSGSDFYVSKGRHAEGYEHGTLDGLRECEICIDESARWDILVKYCWKGKVYYDSPETKFDFLNRMM